MHWFDELAKGAAAGTLSRKIVLRGFAALAGASSVPWAATAVASPNTTMPKNLLRTGLPPLQSTAISKNRTLGIGGRQRLPTPGSTISTCKFQSGSFAISIDQIPTIEGSPAKPPLRTGVKSKIEISRDGATLLHIDIDLHPVAAHEAASGTVALRYGGTIRGIRTASFTVANRSVSGRIDDRPIETYQGNSGHSDSFHFSDRTSTLVLAMDPALRTELMALPERVKSDAARCSSPSHLQRARRRTHDGYIVADAGDYQGYTLQNILAGETTPHCTNCIKNTADSFLECAVGAAAQAFFCPPCGISALLTCYIDLPIAIAACFVPGSGCDEVSCLPDSVGACDKSFNCCGSICCPQNDTCYHVPDFNPTKSGGSICCPPTAPVGCGDPTRPFCCSPGSVCCDNGTCCDSGLACSPGGACVGCGPGQKIVGGVCCEPASICGSTCCAAPTMCDPQTKTCKVPSFGAATPKPRVIPCTLPKGQTVFGQATGGSKFGELCYTPGHPASTILGGAAGVCCNSGETCCGGKCCGPNPSGGAYYCKNDVCTFGAGPK